ncbi:peptidase inhibitor family I36 protein [Saccharomonospora sp. NPDC006951]
MKSPVLTRIAAVLALTGGLIAVSPAGATGSRATDAEDALAMAQATCGSGYICVWTGPGFSGAKYELTATPPGGCRYPAVFGFMSAYNRTGFTQRLHSNSDCTGGNMTINSGTAIEYTGLRAGIGGYP